MTELNGSVEAWSEFDLVAAEQVSTSAAVPHLWKNNLQMAAVYQWERVLADWNESQDSW